jgi:hypothetical protein
MGAGAVKVTALVLSARPYPRAWPGVQVVVHEAVITNARTQQTARFEAIGKVKTEHFFYLDDDDELPDGFGLVLEQCIDANAAVVYTDEIERTNADQVRKSAPYSQAAHLRNGMLIHHLALCKTVDAVAAISKLPRGPYWAEMMLYWELAKTSSAYVPQIGYVWNRRIDGLHTMPDIVLSQVQTALWCKDHL